MVSSFKKLRSDYNNVFDGIDLDIEGGGEACLNYINDIAIAFKKEGFLVSCAPTAGQLHIGTPAKPQQNQFASINLDYFDFVMPQWYEPGCITTQTLNGPYPNNFDTDAELHKFGQCPRTGDDWVSNALEYITLWTKYSSLCNTNDLKSDAQCTWPSKPPNCGNDPSNMFGDLRDSNLNRLKFDSDKINKLVIGCKTWASSPEEAGSKRDSGVVSVNDIKNLINKLNTQNITIGGVGAWAIYHQCGTGDSKLASNFASTVGEQELGLSWYEKIGQYFDEN